MTTHAITTVECSGIGASAFLQGQLTCNVSELLENSPQLTACCNLQGRVIFIAKVIKNKERYLLIIPSSMQKIVINHLEKYAKFSKCLINPVEERGWSSFSHQQDIRNGIPMIYPETSEKIIAQRLNLHLLPGTVSFKKGCYLGQEVLARLHFKGQLKHHLYLGEATIDEINYGAAIHDEQQKVTGTVIDFFIEHNKMLFLFVNAVENKTPYLQHHKITLIPLPSTL